MVDHATAKYLNDNIGGVLAKGLAEMAVAQPADGVDFLAQWLKTYAEEEEAKAERAKEQKALDEERTKVKERNDAKDQERQKAIDLQKQKDAQYEKLLEKFRNPETDFDEAFWTELVNQGAIMGANSTYLGIAEEGGIDNEAGPCIYYTHADEANVWMTANNIRLPKDRKMGEEVESCVTWGAIEKDPPDEQFDSKFLWKPPSTEPEAPPPADGEEAADAPAVAKPPFYPVFIKCVTDVEKVHYFKMTRLGSFAAVPLVYTSYLTNDALTGAKEFEKQRQTRMEELAKLEEQAEAAAAAEPVEGSEEQAATLQTDIQNLKAQLEEDMKLTGGEEIRRIFCMDTLGKNTVINEADIVRALELSKACGECKSAAEKKKVGLQAKMFEDQQMREQIDNEIKSAKESVEAEMNEEVQEAELDEAKQEQERQLFELDETLKDLKADLFEKKKQYNKISKVALQLKDRIIQLGSWVVASQDMKNVLAAVAFMYGHSKDDVYHERKKDKKELSWDKLVALLNDALFDKISKEDVVAPRKSLPEERKLSAICALYEGNDVDKATAEWPALGLLLNLLQDSCNYRNASLKFYKAQYDAWKKMTEQEEKPEGCEGWFPSSLAEVDADYDVA